VDIWPWNLPGSLVVLLHQMVDKSLSFGKPFFAKRASPIHIFALYLDKKSTDYKNQRFFSENIRIFM